DENEDGEEYIDNFEEEEEELDEYTEISDAIENEKMVNKTFKIYNMDHVVYGLTICAVVKK
nr:ferredoxin-dependent glutamate synthase, chloroplastic [Tanacetum cinerariifolium]